MTCGQIPLRPPSVPPSPVSPYRSPSPLEVRNASGAITHDRPKLSRGQARSQPSALNERYASDAIRPGQLYLTRAQAIAQTGGVNDHLAYAATNQTDPAVSEPGVTDTPKRKVSSYFTPLKNVFSFGRNSSKQGKEKFITPTKSLPERSSTDKKGSIGKVKEIMKHDFMVSFWCC